MSVINNDHGDDDDGADSVIQSVILPSQCR